MYLAVYPPLANHSSLFTGVQFILSALAILPPTILMGASLPLLARFDISKTSGMVGSCGRDLRLEHARRGLRRGRHNVWFAARAWLELNHRVSRDREYSRGRGRNLHALAQVGCACGRGGRFDAVQRNRCARSPGHESSILIGFAASGFAATTFEVSWTRLLAMVMGSSVYAFGTLVVVVLAGLGLGSAVYSLTQRTATAEEHRRWFAILEFLIACTAALSLIVLPRIPFLFIRYFPLFRDAFRRQIAAHFVAAAMVALAPSLLFGATFPAVVGSLGGTAARFGRTIGAAYVANTIGTVVGAGLAGFVLIPTFGLRTTMTLGVLATAGAGLGVWWRLALTEAPAHRRVDASVGGRFSSSHCCPPGRAKCSRPGSAFSRPVSRGRRDARGRRQPHATPLLPRRHQHHDLRRPNRPDPLLPVQWQDGRVHGSAGHGQPVAPRPSPDASAPGAARRLRARPWHRRSRRLPLRATRCNTWISSNWNRRLPRPRGSSTPTRARCSTIRECA